MGALTIKPLAYKARSWELNNIEITNFLDSYCGQIAVQKRGSDIIRILPSRKDYFYWISDKVRFFFESLKKQRITYPYFLLEKKYVKLNWKNIIVFIKYMKYILYLMNELNQLEQQLYQKKRKMYKNILENNITPKGDLLSNMFLKLIFQKQNLIKYTNKNYEGNKNLNYYSENLLNTIKNNKYNILNNIYIINDYPRIWSYIKTAKIILIGVKKNINFYGLTLNNTTEEINKIKKAKHLLEIFAKDLIIFTEKYIENINIKQILLYKDTEELNGKWFDNKISNYTLDKDNIIWNMSKDNKKKNGLNINFAIHGDEEYKKTNQIILPITTFMEEYSLRLDPYGKIQKSIPTNIRAINMRTLAQILKIIKTIFNSNNIEETLIEYKLLRDIFILKYGEITENFKKDIEFLKFPKIIETKIILTSNYKENELYKYSEILNIKKSISKKDNNY